MPDTMVPISVVITTFNQSHFLARAIDSVVGNAVKPIDILVVDDGSDDNSSETVCRNYPDVRHFRQANQGVSTARNNGLSRACGEWVIHLDADDWLLPSAIHDLGQLAGSSPEAAFVIGRSERRWADTSRQPTESPPVVDSGDPYCDLLVSGALWHPAQVLFNKRCMQDSGGWKQLPVAEDLEILLRLGARYSYRFLPAVVSIYFQHSLNVSGNSWKMFRGIDGCFRTLGRENALSSQSRAAMATSRANRLDFYGRGILLDGLSEMRKTHRPWKMIHAMALIVSRRPLLLGWFLRFLYVRSMGKTPPPTTTQ